MDAPIPIRYIQDLSFRDVNKKRNPEKINIVDMPSIILTKNTPEIVRTIPIIAKIFAYVRYLFILSYTP